jgi:hypothetical protein
MCLEKNFWGIPGAIPAGHCDHVRSCRLLKERPIAIFGQAAGRLDMIGRRGFRVVGTPRASSGSVRVGLPLPGENHAPSVYEAHRSPRITLPRRERAPPELTRVNQRHWGPPAPDMALGQRRAPLAQANQSPPDSTTERSQL